jgi:hypothetical protein
MKHFDDLTKIDVPIYKLDKDTQKRLRVCKHIEYYRCVTKRWIKSGTPLFHSFLIYRQIAPTPMTRQQVLGKYNVKVED